MKGHHTHMDEEGLESRVVRPSVGIWLEGHVNRRRGRVAVCGEGDLVELVVEMEEVEVERERERSF